MNQSPLLLSNNPETPDAAPSFQTEALPLWVWILCCLFLFWAGAYLMSYSGGFQSDVFNESAVTYGAGANAGPKKP